MPASHPSPTSPPRRFGVPRAQQALQRPLVRVAVVAALAIIVAVSAMTLKRSRLWHAITHGVTTSEPLHRATHGDTHGQSDFVPTPAPTVTTLRGRSSGHHNGRRGALADAQPTAKVEVEVQENESQIVEELEHLERHGRRHKRRVHRAGAFVEKLHDSLRPTPPPATLPVAEVRRRRPNVAPSQEPLWHWIKQWTGQKNITADDVPFADTGKIPSRIFMTWKAKQLTMRAQQYWDEWADHEPNLDLIVLNDDECAFLASLYPSLKPRYDGLPLNVMRADICRVLAVYFFGGLYKDMDVAWVRPLSEWFNYNDHVVYGWEDEEHVCQWFFAARPGDPCVRNILQQITNIIANVSLIDFNKNIEAVIDITGPGVWTDAIQGCPTPPAYTVDEMKFTNVYHDYASQRWGGPDYGSWIVERKKTAGWKEVWPEFDLTPFYRSGSGTVLRPVNDEYPSITVMLAQSSTVASDAPFAFGPRHAFDGDLETTVATADESTPFFELTLSEPMTIGTTDEDPGPDHLSCLTVYNTHRQSPDDHFRKSLHLELFDDNGKHFFTLKKEGRKTVFYQFVFGGWAANVTKLRLRKPGGVLMFSEIQMFSDHLCMKARRVHVNRTLPDMQRRLPPALRLATTVTHHCPTAHAIVQNSEFRYATCEPFDPVTCNVFVFSSGRAVLHHDFVTALGNVDCGVQVVSPEEPVITSQVDPGLIGGFLRTTWCAASGSRKKCDVFLDLANEFGDFDNATVFVDASPADWVDPEHKLLHVVTQVAPRSVLIPLRLEAQNLRKPPLVESMKLLLRSFEVFASHMNSDAGSFVHGNLRYPSEVQLSLRRRDHVHSMRLRTDAQDETIATWLQRWGVTTPIEKITTPLQLAQLPTVAAGKASDASSSKIPRRTFTALAGKVASPGLQEAEAAWKRVRAQIDSVSLDLDSDCYQIFQTGAVSAVTAEAMDAISPAYRADVCRLYAVFLFGGVTFDRGMVPKAAFTKWLPSDAEIAVGHMQHDGGDTGSLIGAVPGQKCMKRVIRHVLSMALAEASAVTPIDAEDVTGEGAIQAGLLGCDFTDVAIEPMFAVDREDAEAFESRESQLEKYFLQAGLSQAKTRGVGSIVIESASASSLAHPWLTVASAFDGDPDTVVTTKSEADPWFSFTLREPKFVGGVAGDDTEDRIFGLRVYNRHRAEGTVTFAQGLRLELYDPAGTLIYRAVKLARSSMPYRIFTFAGKRARVGSFKILKALPAGGQGATLTFAEVELCATPTCDRVRIIDATPLPATKLPSDVPDLLKLVFAPPRRCSDPRAASLSDAFQYAQCGDFPRPCDVYAVAKGTVGLDVSFAQQLAAVSECTVKAVGQRPSPELTALAGTSRVQFTTVNWCADGPCAYTDALSSVLPRRNVAAMHIQATSSDWVAKSTILSLAGPVSAQHVFVPLKITAETAADPQLVENLKAVLKSYRVQSVHPRPGVPTVKVGGYSVPSELQLTLRVRAHPDSLDAKVQRWTGASLDEVALPLVSEASRIPARVYVVHRAHRLPTKVRATVKEWTTGIGADADKKVEVIVLDDADCGALAATLPGLRPHYDELGHAAMRADVCRILAVYLLGGVATQVMSKVHKPLTSWLDFKAETSAVFARNREGHVSPKLFAAPPGDACMHSVLQLAVTFLENMNGNEEEPDLFSAVALTVGLTGCASASSKRTVKQLKEYATWGDSSEGGAAKDASSRSLVAMHDYFTAPVERFWIPPRTDSMPLNLQSVTASPAHLDLPDLYGVRSVFDMNLDTALHTEAVASSELAVVFASPMSIDTWAVANASRLTCVRVYNRHRFQDPAHFSAKLRLEAFDSDQGDADPVYRYVAEASGRPFVQFRFGGMVPPVRRVRVSPSGGGSLTTAEVQFYSDAACLEPRRVVVKQLDQQRARARAAGAGGSDGASDGDAQVAAARLLTLVTSVQRSCPGGKPLSTSGDFMFSYCPSAELQASGCSVVAVANESTRAIDCEFLLTAGQLGCSTTSVARAARAISRGSASLTASFDTTYIVDWCSSAATQCNPSAALEKAAGNLTTPAVLLVDLTAREWELPTSQSLLSLMEAVRPANLFVRLTLDADSDLVAVEARLRELMSGYELSSVHLPPSPETFRAGEDGLTLPTEMQLALRLAAEPREAATEQQSSRG